VREKHPVDSASGGQRTARPTSDRVLTKQNPQRKCGWCSLVAARLAPQKSSPDGTVKKGVGRRRFVQANSPARSGLHQTLADMEVIPSTEPKAVLEHRAPKTSPPILHTRSAESKVGRAVHCAPVWVVLTPASRFESGFSAPLRARLQRRAALGRSKRRVFEGKALSKPAAVRARAIPNFGRRRSRQSTEPKAVLEHRAPKTSTTILHTRGVESKVGRAVHCAPGLVVLTRLLGLNLVFRGLTGAATAARPSWSKKP